MAYSSYSVVTPVVFGVGAIDELGARVKEMGCKRALCIYDKGIEAAGITAKAFTGLKSEGIEVNGYDGVIPDPTLEVVNGALDAARAFNADVIIGVGGGSSMDTAKAAAIAYDSGQQPIEFVKPQPIRINVNIPIILIPTTAGTGSEVTSVAIISRPELDAKWSVFTNTALALIDPALTVTLPKFETAATGLDALAHAAESMTTIMRTLHNTLFGVSAIKKITNWLRIAYNEPDNIEARTEMALAANWAGFAFNNPLTHVGHACADAISVKLHTSHGYNCAITLPEAMALVAPVLPNESRAVAEALGVKLSGSESGEALGALIADTIRKLMSDVGIAPLRDLGVSRSDITALAADVAASHLSSYCPMEITIETAEALLGRIYDSY